MIFKKTFKVPFKLYFKISKHFVTIILKNGIPYVQNIAGPSGHFV